MSIQGPGQASTLGTRTMLHHDLSTQLWTQLFFGSYPMSLKILSSCPCKLRVGTCPAEEWTHMSPCKRSQDQFQAPSVLGWKLWLTGGCLGPPSMDTPRRPMACSVTLQATVRD